MALVVEDMVQESSTTTGTGDFTLAAAVTGYRRFSSVCSTNDTFHYAIQAVDGNGVPTGDWEVGYGTYSAANTLTRTTVVASSNAGAAVNFASGTKYVRLSATAQHLKFRGALVKKSADQTAANYTTNTAIAWDAEEYDTSSIHDNSTNNTRLTVPTGVTKVRLCSRVGLSNVTADMWVVGSITKNGSTFTGSPSISVEAGVTTPRLSISSAVVDVVAGDYFEFMLQVETDTSIDVVASASWFAMEIIA